MPYVGDLLLEGNCQSMLARIQADTRARQNVRVGSGQFKILEMVIEDKVGGMFVANCNAVQEIFVTLE